MYHNILILRWSLHVEFISTKIAKRIHVVGRLTKYIPTKTPLIAHNIHMLLSDIVALHWDEHVDHALSVFN